MTSPVATAVGTARRWWSTATATTTRRRLLVILVVAAVVRLTWSLYVLRDLPTAWVNADGYGYWYAGNEMAHFRGYHWYACPGVDVLPCRGGPTAYYPPGFPALLAGIFLLDRVLHLPLTQPHLVALLGTALGTASVALVFAIGRRLTSPLFGAGPGGRVGLGAAALMAVFPSHVVGAGSYAIENTFVFVLLGVVWWVMRHEWASPWSTRALLWFGAVFGLAILVRPFVLPVLVGLGGAALVAGFGRRQALRHLALPLITVAVVLTPWTIRNAVHFGAFVPVSTNLGDTACMSRYPGSTGGYAWAKPPWCAPEDTPEAERNSINTRRAIRFVIEHPGEEVRQWGRRLTTMMRDDTVALKESLDGQDDRLTASQRRAVGAVSNVTFHATWITSLAGLAMVVRAALAGRRAGRRRLGAVVASITIVTMAGLIVIPMGLWGAIRFHAPLVPFFVILAVLAVVTVVEFVTGRVRPGHPADAPA